MDYADLDSFSHKDSGGKGMVEEEKSKKVIEALHKILRLFLLRRVKTDVEKSLLPSALLSIFVFVLLLTGRHSVFSRFRRENASRITRLTTTSRTHFVLARRRLIRRRRSQSAEADCHVRAYSFFLSCVTWVLMRLFQSVKTSSSSLITVMADDGPVSNVKVIKDVSDRFIADFFDCVDFALLSILRITRCRSLPNRISNFGGKPETLVLEDISSEINLLGFITNWLGENLWLDRCHSFSGMDLKALGSRTAGLYPCNGMDCLLLYRLPPFSISLLKKMIEERNSEVRYDDPNWKTTTEFGPTISHLAVVHCGTGELSVEDEIWFRSRLVEFYWGSCTPSLNPSH